jgi:trimeric autotransporter adhesin
MTTFVSSRAIAASVALALTVTLSACGGGGGGGGTVASAGSETIGTPPTGGGGTGGIGGTGSGANCPLGTTAGTPIGTTSVCNLAGTVTTNLTLPNTSGIAYRLVGRVDIGRDVGAAGTNPTGASATLTIEPGVRVFGDEAADTLIINRGSQINAVGTSTQPIIFTGKEDIEGTANAATSNRLWGGVILLGRAPIRGCSTAVAQGSVECQNAVEGVAAASGSGALYGGATAGDNSGTMRYVQIRYPGEFLTSAAAGDDLNGLTLGGVGSATDLSFIQVHNSGDDGVEVFGGTVNLKNLVITGSLDDGLDFDEGWTGNVQFLVIKQSALTGGPDRLFEGSNRTVSSLAGGTLNTNPIISNFTAVGVRTNSAGGGLQGVVLNNTGGTPGGSGRFLNGVVTGSTVCAVASAANTAPATRFDSVLFDCPTAPDATTTALIAAGANNTTTTPSSLTSALLPGTNEAARAAANPVPLNPFFVAANYVGAFSPTATVGNNWAALWTIQLLPAIACPAGTVENGVIGGQKNCVLSGVVGAGTVPADLRLTAGVTYQISGRVDVGVDRGATLATGTAASLSIDPGVRLYGSSSADVLIVNRGSRLFVNGTASAPVVLTSRNDVAGTQPNKATASREWAGLIVLGAAPIRGCSTAVAQGSVDCQNAIEGITAATGRSALYGGATSADSSGRISFLQIRYPGAFLTSAAAGDDLNGLTLGGVGSGTTISNIQVHNSGDDGIEIFGGTVNLRNWIVTGALDDSLDFDEGWTGKAQFGIILQALTATGGPDRLIEGSNRAVSSLPGGTLNTFPTIVNFTFVGVPVNDAGGGLTGIILNNTGGSPGGSARFANGVVAGSSVCVNAETANTNPVPLFDSVLSSCSGAYGAVATARLAAGANNSTGTAATLVNRFTNGSAETARPAFNASTLDPFFVATTYIGAVRDAADTWWQGWSCGLAAGSTC